MRGCCGSLPDRRAQETRPTGAIDHRARPAVPALAAFTRAGCCWMPKAARRAALALPFSRIDQVDSDESISGIARHMPSLRSAKTGTQPVKLAGTAASVSVRTPLTVSMPRATCCVKHRRLAADAPGHADALQVAAPEPAETLLLTPDGQVRVQLSLRRHEPHRVTLRRALRSPPARHAGPDGGVPCAPAGPRTAGPAGPAHRAGRRPLTARRGPSAEGQRRQTPRHQRPVGAARLRAGDPRQLARQGAKWPGGDAEPGRE